jgi:hypothetical protein
MSATHRRERSAIAATVFEVLVGAVTAIAVWLAYIIALGEPGSWFYPFAGLLFVGSPIIAGLVAARRARGGRGIPFIVAGGAIFALAWILFLGTYAILPQFARTSVRLPASCDGIDGAISPPASLAYTLPGMATGILLASDERSVVVAVIDATSASATSTVYLANKRDNAILRQMRFDNDVVIASIAGGVLYLFNDKLGYLIDTGTGQRQANFLIIDNYGGLSESDRPIVSRASDGHWYLETTAIISSWKTDGTVRSRPHLTMSGIARGCFVNGATGEITPISR